MATKRCDARFGYLARLNRSLEMSALFNHSEIKTLASGIDHAEGLCVGLQGEIYLGSESGKIYRVTLDGEFSVVAQSSAAGILLGLSIRKTAIYLYVMPRLKLFGMLILRVILGQYFVIKLMVNLLMYQIGDAFFQMVLMFFLIREIGKNQMVC